MSDGAADHEAFCRELSVEERMLMLQERKQRLADTLLGGGGGRFSVDEIDDLFAPLAD